MRVRDSTAMNLWRLGQWCYRDIAVSQEQKTGT